MTNRIITVTLTLPIDGNLHESTFPGRIQRAVTAFLRTLRNLGVGVDLDGATMEVEYNYRRFGYTEPLGSPRPQGPSGPIWPRAAG